MQVGTMPQASADTRVGWRLVAPAMIAVAALVSLWGCTEPIRDEPAGGGDAAPAAHVSAISHGERINLDDHVVSGKTTIFDFYSDYCPPCKAISPELEGLARRRDDLVVVKVDINRPGVRGIDWESPVARQFSLQSIPHFIICDGDGRIVAEGREAYSRVRQWLSQ